MGCGCIVSAIQALIGLMSVLYPNGLSDKDQVACEEGAENLVTL